MLRAAAGRLLRVPRLRRLAHTSGDACETSCLDCRRLAPDAVDAHLVLAPEAAETYALDLAAVRQRYIALQRRVHPDAGLPDASLPSSAALSAAYETLRCPAARAVLLFRRRYGSDPDAGGDEAVVDCPSRLDDATLDEIMEQRAAVDQSITRAELEVWGGRARAALDAAVARLDALFADASAPADDVRAAIAALRFRVALVRAVDARMAAFPEAAEGQRA